LIAPKSNHDTSTGVPLRSGLGPLGAGALIIAALYVGREVFVSVALAILLSFVLAPLVRLLRSVQVPRSIAVVSVVLVAFASISGLAALMASQVTELAGGRCHGNPY